MATYPPIINWSNFRIINIVMGLVASQMRSKFHQEVTIETIILEFSPELGETFKTYKAIVSASVKGHAQSIQMFVAEHAALPRKEFASLVMKQIDPRLRSIAFATLDGKEPLAILRKMLMKASSTDAGTKAYCDLFGLPWDTAGVPATVH